MKEITIGQKFGLLTITNKYTDENGRTMYHCQCECGNTKEVKEKAFKIGIISSCGCARKVNNRSKALPVIPEGTVKNPFEIFTNENFGDLRIIVKNKEPWFVAKDVCKSVDIKNVSQACSRLLVNERDIIINDTPGYPQELIIVSESGLYTLIMTSRLPKAKEFRAWVTSEVLPSIRKTGRYELGNQVVPKARKGRESLASVNRTVGNLFKACKMTKVNNQLVGETVFNVYRQFGIDLPGLPGQDKLTIEAPKQISLEEINPPPMIQTPVAESPQIDPATVKSVTAVSPQLIENLPTFMTCTEIAKQLGVYSVNNIPHSKLISAIIRHIKIPAAMSTMAPYRNMKSGYEGDATLYHPTVANMVKDYLSRHDCPPSIRIDNKFYTISYKMAIGRRK